MMDPCGPASRINFLINCLSSRNPLITIDKTASITVVIYSSRMPSVVPGTHFRFGPFELDAATGELRKHGIRVRLPNQPSQVLTRLLIAANEIVTREELRQQIWSGNTFVDFEHGLSVAVNKLRQALNDTAENPRYIETLPGRGYRFVAPVEAVSTPEPARGARPSLPPALSRPRMWLAALAVFLMGAITGWLIRPQQSLVPSPVQFTVALPQELFSEPAFNAQDFSISPDGRQLAFVASDSAKSGLWIRRFGTLDPARLAPEHNVRSVEWSSDGHSIYFGEMGILKRVPAVGGAVETVYELPSGAGDWNSLVEFDHQRILFNRVGKAFSAAPAGGTATTLKRDDGEHLWARILPGGYLLYVRVDQQIHRFRASASHTSDLKDRRALMETDSRVLYAPPMPGRHATSLNLSPPERPKCCDSAICSLDSTFTAKCVATSKVGKLWLVRLADQSTRGGSSETDENELAVMPTSLPSAAAVITVTPVPNCPSERRNAAGSSLGSPASRAVSGSR